MQYENKKVGMGQDGGVWDRETQVMKTHLDTTDDNSKEDWGDLSHTHNDDATRPLLHFQCLFHSTWKQGELNVIFPSPDLRTTRTVFEQVRPDCVWFILSSNLLPLIITFSDKNASLFCQTKSLSKVEIDRPPTQWKRHLPRQSHCYFSCHFSLHRSPSAFS